MSAMLARSAENIYWMGRYLERSANLCRNLFVAEQLTVEIRGLAPNEAIQFWHGFQKVYPGSPRHKPFSDVDKAMQSGMHSFLLGTKNALSVVNSIRKRKRERQGRYGSI